LIQYELLLIWRWLLVFNQYQIVLEILGLILVIDLYSLAFNWTHLPVYIAGLMLFYSFIILEFNLFTWNYFDISFHLGHILSILKIFE
jgi:hypothetical protein